jgi:hypothetical protein
VADWRASGLTADEFAARRGLSVNALRYWAYGRRKASPPVRSLEVVRVERACNSMTPAPPSGVTIMIELGGARVSVPAGSDAATLRVVLDALRAAVRPA